MTRAKGTSITKDMLIDGALTALDASEGMDGLTVDLLAAQLHMSKSTLYKYFDGLQDLVYSTVEHLCEKTESELGDVSGTPEEVFNGVARVYGSYAVRVPGPLFTNRHKLSAAARLRLENMEDRLGERMFKAAVALNASPVVAHGVRAAFNGAVRFLRTVPAEQRADQMEQLTSMFTKGLA